MKLVKTDVLIIGSGPAGLSAAIQLHKTGIDNVIVVEREPMAGGTPQFCDHFGFGIRDKHWLYSGPQYADQYARTAVNMGVDIRTETQATGWGADNSLYVTSPEGRYEIKAEAILLATGCRERPRSARLIPGDRCRGIFTTGSLQRFISKDEFPVGRNAVVCGAENVSYSAVSVLISAGVKIRAVITEHSSHQAFWPYKMITADLRGVPLICRSQVINVKGDSRVKSVEIKDLGTGKIEKIHCDTVVFTGNWIPENELIKLAGLPIDHGTESLKVGQSLRSPNSGIFAAGNLLHGAEPADIAALEGQYVADQIYKYLNGNGKGSAETIEIGYESPIKWVFPQFIESGNNKSILGRFTLRVEDICQKATLEILQGTNLLWKERYQKLMPNKPIYLPDNWLSKLEPVKGDVRIEIK